MSFLARLLGRRADPTLGWVTFSLPIPDFDIRQMSFGLLRFGDPLETAAFLGRPDRFEWRQGDFCELLYAAGGFQIDFDGGGLAYLAFFVGPDEYLPKHPDLEFSQPLLRGCSPDGVRLSGETDRMMLERLLGQPDSTDSEPQETILFYHPQGVTMEFEMDGPSGRLKRWNLYPE